MLSLVISPTEQSAPATLETDPSAVNVWRTAEGELCAVAGSDDGEYWLQVPSVATFRFAAGGDSVTAVPHAPARPDLIRRAFDHSVLPLTLQALGREGLHASAVLTAHGVVGFCGKTHTGKSTLAFALSQRGLEQWADDSLVWDLEDGHPSAISLPFHVRLRPESVSFFGSCPDARRFRNTEGRKPITALYVLRRTAFDPTAPRLVIERLAGGHALTTLLDHAHCFNPCDAIRKRQMMVNYLTLMSRVPVFDVRFQPSLSLLSELVDTFVTVLSGLHVPARSDLEEALETTAAI
jgi:hypothetical protein